MINYLGKLKKTLCFKALLKISKKRILILDGAMGTEIQKFKLKNINYKSYLNIIDLQKGNNDILNLTQPKIIEYIHNNYIKAGADIIETNTFSSNKISQIDYKLQEKCFLLNKFGALIAKRICLKYSFIKNKRLFITGSIGPTNRTASISSDVLNPSFRSITFDELKNSYKEQMLGLISGKIDMFTIETIFDTLNAKAAIYAYLEISLKLNKYIPLMISGTISDKSGRTLSGQTPTAFWISIKHANPFSIGFNCALGAENMQIYIEELSPIVNTLICAYPNAGLPNEFGIYTETAKKFVNKIKNYLKKNLVNIIGGCCGSNPKHIIELKKLIKNKLPRKLPKNNNKNLSLSGLNPLIIKRKKFYEIGERTNITGSSIFKKLIINCEYNKALEIIREQIINGAKIIDINMDESLLDSKKEMCNFINLISSEPDISKIPIMLDSSKWNVLIEGLKCLQGKGIVNSISLKEGKENFLNKAQKIKMLGATMIIIAFDENGQANTIEKRLEICEKTYNLLITYLKFIKEDIIFDLNIFAIATGLSEHNNYAIDFIKSVKLISFLYPKSSISGGISNLSFSFRGNNWIRESMHSVFLHYAIKAGLNMGIVNVNKKIKFENINIKIRQLCFDIIWNTRKNAIDDIMLISNKNNIIEKSKKYSLIWRTWKSEQKLSYSIISGIEKYINKDTMEIINKGYTPIKIIEGPLMDAMNIVGDLFGSGKMFLPQVVKSARVMKKSVTVLVPFMKKQNFEIKKTILLATVKGDVHDIGKNIVGIILSCNNYKIIDLGIMVSAENIIKFIKKKNVDIIGLSGLITPSLDEMIKVATQLQINNFRIPLLIGGATTSKIHTAIKIYPIYKNGLVIHITDASKAVSVASKLFSTKNKEFIENIKNEYLTIRNIYIKSKIKKNQIKFSKTIKSIKKKFNIKKPTFIGSKLFTINNLYNIINLIKWELYLKSWKIKSTFMILGIDNNIIENKLIKDSKIILKKIINEKWFNIKCFLIISNVFKNLNDIYITNYKKTVIDIINTLRQQFIGNYLSICDNLNKINDYISFFSCTASYEVSIITSYFKKKEKHYYSILIKTICDKIIEECSNIIFKIMRNFLWGFLDQRTEEKSEGIRSGIRPTPGYPICPDHIIKFNIFKILNLNEKLSLLLTNKLVMIPQSSICGLIISDIRSKYFGIININKDQIKNYSKRLKSIQVNIEKNLISLISYIPKYIQ